MKSDPRSCERNLCNGVRSQKKKISKLLELCRALRNNYGLLALHLEEGGYFLIIFFGFAKLSEVVIYQ